MLKRKELIHVILAIIIMFVIISFTNLITLRTLPTASESQYYLKILGYSALIIAAAVFAKKLVAQKIDVDIEHKIFGLQRYWFYKKAYFKKPLPIGAILPLILTAVSGGLIKMFTLLQFDSTALVSKASKGGGGPNVRTAEINEADLGLIAFWGTIVILAVSLIANFFTQTADLAKYALYYSIWNIIPFGQLDGMKLLMSAGAPIHSSTARNATKMIAPLYFITLILIAITAVIVLF